MSRSSPWSAHDTWTSRLRTLAETINDVLPAMDTRPAVAGVPAPIGPSANQSAARASVTAPRSRPGPRPRPRPDATAGESRRADEPATASSPATDRPAGHGADQGGDHAAEHAGKHAAEHGAEHGGDHAADLAAGPRVDDEHADSWGLVQRSQDGDGEAFGLLYDRYVDTVFRFIYFRVNDRALAEDFTSETFLRALRRIGSFSYQGRDVGAWFVTIARNIVFDHMKSARHRLELTTGDTIESRDHERSTESAVLDTLRSEELMAAIAKLGDEQRECVMLRFIQGLSVSETAAVMSKNDGAIKALQHRAVRKLADLVGGDLR